MVTNVSDEYTASTFRILSARTGDGILYIEVQPHPYFVHTNWNTQCSSDECATLQCEKYFLLFLIKRCLDKKLLILSCCFIHQHPFHTNTMQSALKCIFYLNLHLFYLFLISNFRRRWNYPEKSIQYVLFIIY
jgi:hypothetical protein